MAGAVLIIVALVLVFPVLVLMSMAALAGLTGWVLNREVDATFEGSELLTLADTNSSVPTGD